MYQEKYNISSNDIDSKKNLRQKMEQIVLNKKDEFIKRGNNVVYSFYRDNWSELVNNSLKEDIWYNGVIIEAALQCMEDLTLNGNVSRAYELINIQERSCVFLNMEISEMENSYVTGIIKNYHQLGKDFSDYRDFYISNYKNKQK